MNNYTDENKNSLEALEELKEEELLELHQIQTTLEQRQKSNPLKYFWPHQRECNGVNCDQAQITFQTYDGKRYSIRGCPQFEFLNSSQDIILGCYWLTKMIQGVKGEGRIFSSPNEAVLAHEFNQVDLQARIKVKKTNNPKYKIFKDDLIETTVGRLLFNGVLPGDFEFVNEELKKGDLNRIVERLISRYQAETPAILDKIKDFGFRYATKSGISWGIDDVVEPKAKPEIIRRAVEEASKIQKLYDDGLLNNNERYERVVQIWRETKQKVDALVQHSLDPLGSVHNIVSSAARGSWNQINQIAGMKGSVRNPAGQIIELPILNSYKAGLTVLEYFISTHGARKGLTDTALKTAAAGYLTRRLVDVAQDVIISETDCKTTKGLEIVSDESEEINKTLGQRAFSRITAEDIKDPEGKIITEVPLCCEFKIAFKK